MLIKALKKFFLLPVLLLQACFSRFSGEVDKDISDSYYYAKKSGEIVYSPMGNWFELGYDKMDADTSTFRPIARDFGKDKNHVYYKSSPLSKVDYATFVVEEDIIKDKNHVYEKDYFELSIVEDADPESFHYLNSRNDYSRKWAKDNFNYFLYNKKVDVDFKSFRELKNEIVVDKNFIYDVVDTQENENGEIGYPEYSLAKIDPVIGEIQELTDVYARMGNNIYANHSHSGFQKIAFDSIATVEVVATEHIVVNKTLLIKGEKFPFVAVDIASFENAGGSEPYEYTRDKNHIYYEGKVLPDADLATFQIIKWGYAKDKNNVYFLETIVEGANPETFIYDEKKFDFVDGKDIYRYGKLFRP